MASSHRQLRGYWLIMCVLIVLGPLVVLLRVDRASWGNRATEMSVLSGLLGLSFLLVAFALPTRLDSILSSFGIEWVLRRHRLVGVLAVGLVGLHVLLALGGDHRGIAIFDLRHAPRPVWAGTTATLALLLLVALALRRLRTQPRYEGWRMLHIGLALAVVVGAGLHIWWLGNLINLQGMRVVYACLAGVAVAVVIRRWMWLPFRARSRVYVVDSVRPVSGNAVTVAVRAHGHGGLPFKAGQFAWLKIGTSPFVFEEHPFTIASTAERPHLKEFTIKALGDFSELLVGLRPGRRVYLDGPYGRFTVDGIRTSGFVFIAGGVGITPMISILRTLADRRDTAAHLLFVGARTETDLMMRDEVDALRARLDLKIVQVLETPPPGWSGKSGRVDGDLLDQVLPRRARHYDYFLCGPPAMVIAVGRLLRDRGIAPRRIHTERFEVV